MANYSYSDDLGGRLTDKIEERFKELETRLEAIEKILETSQIDTTAQHCPQPSRQLEQGVKIARLLERGEL